MEMQEQGAINDMVYDEVHEVENANEQQDYRGPVTRSRDKSSGSHRFFTWEKLPTKMREFLKRDLPILIHIEKFEGDQY